MADWPEIKRHLTSAYDVEIETGEYVTFQRAAGNGRPVTMVAVDHGKHYGRSWVGVGAAVGRRDQGSAGPTGIDLLNINADLPCGGLALTEDGTIMLEYAILINGLGLEAVDERVAFVAEIGAQLGEWFDRATRNRQDGVEGEGNADGNLG